MWLYGPRIDGSWTVGYYEPNGDWLSIGQHEREAAAAQQVHYLNGGGFGNADLEMVEAIPRAIGHLEETLTKHLGHLYDALQRGNNFRG